MADHRLVLVLLWSSMGAMHASAQDSERTFYVTPWAGAFLSYPAGDDLPLVGESGIVEVRMANSAAIGVDLETIAQDQFISLRFSFGSAFFSALKFENWKGDYRRGNNFVSLGNPQGVGSSVRLLTGSILFWPRTTRESPYIVAGAGLKQHNYTNMADELERALVGSRTRGSLHFGLGLSGRRVRLEISDYISRQNFRFEVPGMVGVEESAQLQNDVIITLGVRLGPM